MTTTHIPAQPIVTYERRVDTYVTDGPTIERRSRYSDNVDALHISRVVTTYRRRDIADQEGKWNAAQKAYGRSTLKDGTPSTVESAIKTHEWTVETAELLTSIANENYPFA